MVEINETIFHKILKKEIPSDCVYEDDDVYAFRDINPQAPVHVLIIPKAVDLQKLSDSKEEHKKILGILLYSASVIAKQEKIDEDGFRVVINNGKDGGQEVNYLHVHLLGGKKFNWPPG